MWLGGISCQSVWGLIFQWGSTLKVSIELPATSRHHCNMTERLLKASSPNQTNRLSQKWVGDIGATWRFSIAKTILLRYPWWPPQQPSWRSSIVSSAWALLQVSLCRGLLTMVCLSSICLSVTFHIFGGHLESLQLFSAPKQCRMELEFWWKASGQHRDLELLK